MKFISDFLDAPVPAPQHWMTRYFKSGLNYEFLRYFLLFRCDVHFSEHVGKPCSKRWTKRMKSKLLKLESAYLKARSDMDFDLLADIEMGKFKLK
jgi:hypothetical protein